MGGREGCDANYEVDPVHMAWNGCIILIGNPSEDMIFMNNTEMTALSSLLIELSYLIVHGVTSKINTLLIHFM